MLFALMMKKTALVKVVGGVFAFFPFLLPSLMGEEPGEKEPSESTTRAYVARILEANRSFVARGGIEGQYVGEAPYSDPAVVGFDLEHGYFFSFEPDDPAKAWILLYFANDPADGKWSGDFEWRARTLLTVATDSGRSALVGFPMRAIFNFTWDLFRETQNRGGFRTLLTNGIMIVRHAQHAGGSTLTLTRRLPFGPMRKVEFSFGPDDRFRSLLLIERNGSEHLLSVKRDSEQFTDYVENEIIAPLLSDHMGGGNVKPAEPRY